MPPSHSSSSPDSPRKPRRSRARRSPPAPPASTGRELREVSPETQLTDGRGRFLGTTLRDFRNYDPTADSDLGGVYALLGDDLRVVYVGQTGKYGRRLADHMKGEKGAATFYVAVYPLAERGERLELEAALILRYFPEYNRGLMLGVRGDGGGAGGVWEIRWKK